MKKTIALVTGGYSGESVISYKSADTIFKNLDQSRWNVYLIDIHPNGWFHPASGGEKVLVDKNDFSITLKGKKITFDAVLISLHGTPGEDGKLQGYFDCLKIPYTSCDAATSALTFNKRYTVAVAAFADIPVSGSTHLFKQQPFDTTQIIADLGLPLFVKPNNGGSSLGISKVSEAGHLEAAIHKAFKEDDQVLVEAFIQGREFTIGVFKTGGKIIPLPITEIVPKNEFFDFEAKYEGASDEITPAKIPDTTATVIRNMAVKVYQVFNCRGIVRIDFIWNEADGQSYLLEINTVPGQSAASIVPQQIASMGWSLQQFYTALLEECFHTTDE